MSECKLAESDEFDQVLKILRSGQASKLEGLSRSYTNFPRGEDPYVGEAWFILAIKDAPIQTIRWMLDKGVDVNAKGNTNEAPIQACIDRKSIDRYDILQELIAAGADLDIRGENDWTPLHWAAARNDSKAVRILLEAGADINATTGMDSHATPEEEAVALGASESARVLSEWRSTLQSSRS